MPWQRPLGAGYRQYLHSVDDHSNQLHNQRKPVNSKFSPKIGYHDTQSRLCLHQIALPRKPTPRIKLRDARYHTTKVTAHQTPKPVIANCVPKLVVMATSLSTDGPPNGISIGLAVFAQVTAECPYTLQWGTRFLRQNCPLPWGELDPHLTYGSLGLRESPTQTASRSVQPFLRAH